VRICNFVAFGVLCAAANVAHASISYSAYVSCGNCVTVYASWFSEPQPVYYAEVDDPFGNPLFVLNVLTPYVTTGSIQPDPQTISSLPPTTMYAVTNGMLNTLSDPDPPSSLTTQQTALADLTLFGAGHVPIDSTAFVASVTSVPEPAAWTLLGAGLALIVARSRISRRSRALGRLSQT
jgi:hypothetical protein